MKPLVILLAFAASAANAAPAARLDIPYQMFRLKNGLTVVVHEDHSVPIATVNTWYHVGSSREKPGRTGFAHLFEHLMFEGSKHVPEGAFDRWLEAVGGSNNGSTNEDRTNYYEDVPSNAVELALFLESDRMGYLLDTMSPERVDGQRDIVKNERRQSYENAPYGMASLYIQDALYPPDHPYHWPVIGSMEDLSAASHEDVADFFRRWYTPANASVVVAGDVDAREIRALAEKWFGELPAAEPPPPRGTMPVRLAAEKRLMYEDKVQLPRLYLSWPTPAYLSPPDAALDALSGILAGGKNARLYKRLVYELQVAQDVTAYHESHALASAFHVIVTARAGHGLEEIRKLVDEEIERVKTEPPAARELERFQNGLEAGYLRRLESVAGKAEQLNSYLFATGNPDFFEEDLARYRALSPIDVQAAARQFLHGGRVALSAVPAGGGALALPASEVAR
jgi:zinc protease